MLIAIFAVISVFLLLILKSCSNRTVEERYSISLIGKDSVSMYVGDIYIYVDPGYMAIDTIDGNITSKVSIDGEVNYDKLVLIK